MLTPQFDQLITQVEQLSVQDKLRLIERLTTTLQRDLEVEAFQRMPWHEFIERTAGILADDPIERPPQLPFEEREPLDCF